MANDGPKDKNKPPASMSMIEPRLRNIYLSFYKESYFKPSALDLKTKELIAIGCSLVAKCEGCLEGHIKKALELGSDQRRDQRRDHCTRRRLLRPAGMARPASDKAAIKLDLHTLRIRRDKGTRARGTRAETPAHPLTENVREI